MTTTHKFPPLTDSTLDVDPVLADIGQVQVNTLEGECEERGKNKSLSSVKAFALDTFARLQGYADLLNAKQNKQSLH